MMQSQTSPEDTLGGNNKGDSDECARISIHDINQIQSHGVLFALSEPDLVVRQISVNASDSLGQPAEKLLGTSFGRVLGAGQFEVFRSELGSDKTPCARTVRVIGAGGEVEMKCLPHRQNGQLIVELEFLEGAQTLEPLDLNYHLHTPLRRMEEASGILDLSEVTAREVKRLSGFDRVMVYRFDQDWNGEVIAEAVTQPLDSYLGLRFPASDIPPQARRLFLLNRLRTIANINAKPAAVIPETSPITGRALDMTCSFLRSPAAIHVEYMRNMGVQASLTISIVVANQLWGMIACHHAAPRHVDYATRSVCELIGQMLGSQVALRIDNSELQQRLKSRNLLQNYIAEVDASKSLTYADQFGGPRLLELFDADGLVLSIDGAITEWGHSIEVAALAAVTARLREESTGGIASSNRLREPGEVNGALYVGLTEDSGDYLLLLRRGVLETVTWAGNPDKSMDTDAQGKLRPRACFAAWQEKVRGRSRPWSELELESARLLRERLMRRREELASAQAGRRFRFLADAMPQLIWTSKPDGSVDYYNERWISYTGMSAFMQHGWAAHGAIHPEDMAECHERWVRTLDDEREYEVECRIRRAWDGSYRWHLVRAFPLRNPQGEVIQWIGTCTDIEEHKQARRELERGVKERTAELAGARERLQMVLDGAANVAIIATDTQGLITVFNKGAENMLGYTAAEMVGRHTPAKYHLESELAVRRAELAAPEEREWTYVRRDGSQATVNLVLTRLQDASGETVGFLNVAMDISARKRADSALLEARQLLELQFQELMKTNQELAKRNEEVEGFVYIVSHDLRAPLVNLQGFAKELELSCDELRQTLTLQYEGEDPSPIRLSLAAESRIKAIVAEDIPGSLRYISASTAKFHRLINALLELSRQGRQEYHPQQVSLDALARSTLELMRVSISKSGAAVSLTALPNVHGDPTALGQVLSNLVDNALHYLKPNVPGTVEIGGETDGRMAHCWVRDNGVGLPASAKSRLFQMFQRFHPGLAQGEGMGLAIVKRIVERHGGTVWADSEEGVGSTFHFTLTCAPLPSGSVTGL